MLKIIMISSNSQRQITSHGIFPIDVQARLSAVPLLLTSSAHIPPAPAWLISYMDKTIKRNLMSANLEMM
jgi:hypothetical protein